MRRVVRRAVRRSGEQGGEPADDCSAAFFRPENMVREAMRPMARTAVVVFCWAQNIIGMISSSF